MCWRYTVDVMTCSAPLRRWISAPLTLALVACGGTTFVTSADGGSSQDGGVFPDASPRRDATGRTDAHSSGDSGQSSRPDGAFADATPPTDAGSPRDGQAPRDAPQDVVHVPDGHGTDVVSPHDGSMPKDTGQSTDVQAPKDAPKDVVHVPDAPGVDVVTPHDSSAPTDTSSPHDSGDGSHDSAQDTSTGPSCPASVPSGPCTSEGEACDYPTAVCVCSYGEPITGDLNWNCVGLSTGCPPSPPAIGSACTAAQQGLVCDYGECLDGAERVKCESEIGRAIERPARGDGREACTRRPCRPRLMPLVRARYSRARPCTRSRNPRPSDGGSLPRARR